MIVIILSICLKIYMLLNAFQKSFYEYKSIFKYIIKKHYVLFISNVSTVLLLIFKNQYLNLLAISSITFQLVYILKKSKVFLKITKRILRLLLTISIKIVVLFFFIPLFAIDLLVPILIVLSDLINKPIGKLINKKFLKKASAKLKISKSKKIAITGSYGKTSVKNYIYSVLKKKYLVEASPKSFNTPLGIAKFINGRIFDYTDFVILEFGARRSGDIKELANYYRYDIAIVTEIGMMHIDTFKKVETIIDEKMSLVNLLDHSGIAILNYENDYIRNYDVSCKKYSYGFNHGDFKAKNIELSIFGSKFDLYINDKFVREFRIKPLGKSAILNILPAIVFCYLYAVDYDVVEKIEQVGNRLSLRVLDDYYILDDAYNSNILGAKYALEVLRSHKGKKYIITPGFLEMDLLKEELAIEYGKKIAEAVNTIILVENEFTKLLAKNIDKEVLFVDSFKEGFNLFLNLKEVNSILLIENDLLD